MGHCQLCGHFQKLPNGRLSLHGYNKQWGFFSGTCPGSRALPYEVSTSEIELAITSASQSVLRLEAQLAEALANPGPDVMERDYNQKGKPWVKRTLPLDGTRRNLHLKYSVQTDAELVARFNRAYAASIAQRVAELKQYGAWLAERKANWKPEELKAVAA